MITFSGISWVVDLTAKFLSSYLSRQHYRVVKPLSTNLQGSSLITVPLQRIPSVFNQATDSSQRNPVPRLGAYAQLSPAPVACDGLNTVGPSLQLECWAVPHFSQDVVPC
jgi:hypothetical protein